VTPSAFGNPARYYADTEHYPPKTPGLFDHSHTESTIRRALDRFDTTIQKSVERTVKRWNQSLRDQIRLETGLRLGGGDERHSVSIRVVDGLPKSLASVFDQFTNPVFWDLLLNKTVLKTTLTGLGILQRDLGEILSWPEAEGLTTSEQDIQSTGRVVSKVVEWLEALEVAENLKKIDEDILGAYFFHKGLIQIYWMPIGVIARMLNISVERLTIVVLTHELVHAYTHLGSDIDSEQWATGAFAEADLKIVEGMAQFYTFVVCAKLEGREPGMSKAFDALLSIQSPAYTDFKKWTTPNERAGEIVRFSMIGCRMKKLKKYEAFLEELKKVRERVGRGEPEQIGFHLNRRSLPY